MSAGSYYNLFCYNIFFFVIEEHEQHIIFPFNT